MTPPATGSVRVWADGRSLCWEGDVKMHYLVIVIHTPGSTRYQFNTEILRFNGETVTPEFGSYDSTSVYLFAITSLYRNYALNNASILPTSLSFQIGVSPKVFRQMKCADSDQEHSYERGLERNDVPDSNLCTFSFNPREWVEHLNKQKAQEEEQRRHAAHRNGSNPIKRVIGHIFSSISRTCSNGTMISAAEAAKIRKQLNGHTHVLAPTTENKTNRNKPTDKPTTKEQIMNEQVNTVNTPSVALSSGELALTLTIATDAAVHSYLLSLSSLNGQKVAEATENPIGDNKPTEIKVPECLASKVPLIPDTFYKLDVVAMDKAGNHSTPWTDNVRFDAKQLGIEPVPAPAPMPKPAPQPVKPVLPVNEYSKFKLWVTRISGEIDAFLKTTTPQKNNDKRIAEWKTITMKMDDSIANLEANFSDDEKQSLAGLKTAVKQLKELVEKAHLHNEELIRTANQPNRRTAPPVTEPPAPLAPKPVAQATEDIRPVLPPPPTPVPVPTPTPSNPTAPTVPTPATTPPANSNPSINLMTLVIAGLVGLVGLLLGILIMQLNNDRHRVSDAMPPNDAATSMMPDRIPWMADPRARAYFEKLIELGLLPTGGNLSWCSNSTMNGTNYIGGDSLVNGSFMIKYVLPQTNQPIVVVSNITIAATNTPATTPAPSTKSEQHSIKKKCSYEVEPPVPGAQRNSDGSWGWEIIQHPGEDAYEYRIDPDEYEVTYSYTSTAAPSSTALEAIDSQGSYIPIAIGTTNHRLPAGTLGHRCGVRADTGGVFKIRFIAREKTWNAPGYTQLASVSHSR